MERYIDANKLEKAVIQSKENNPHSNSIQRQMHTHEHRHFLCMLNQAPVVDVVEVVRCKDCIHKVVTEDGEYNPDDIVCDYHMSDGFCENDFCSYGKRKEIENET